MGQSDLQLRPKAIPFQGQIFGYNSNQKSSQQVQQANDIGDLYFLTLQEAGNTLKLYNVRFLRPFYGQITQAYFTLDLKVGTSQAAALGVYIGANTWANEYRMKGEFDEAAGVMEARIKAQHKRIFGTDQPISANPGARLQITGANMTDLVPATGSPPDRSGIYFGVSLLFTAAPDKQNGWAVNKFKVDASQNVGL